MNKTEHERLADAIKTAREHGNIADRITAIEAAVLALLAEGGRS